MYTVQGEASNESVIYIKCYLHNINLYSNIAQ